MNESALRMRPTVGKLPLLNASSKQRRHLSSRYSGGLKIQTKDFRRGLSVHKRFCSEKSIFSVAMLFGIIILLHHTPDQVTRIRHRLDVWMRDCLKSLKLQFQITL